MEATELCRSFQKFMSASTQVGIHLSLVTLRSSIVSARHFCIQLLAPYKHLTNVKTEVLCVLEDYTPLQSVEEVDNRNFVLKLICYLVEEYEYYEILVKLKFEEFLIECLSHENTADCSLQAIYECNTHGYKLPSLILQVRCINQVVRISITTKQSYTYNVAMQLLAEYACEYRTARMIIQDASFPLWLSLLFERKCTLAAKTLRRLSGHKGSYCLLHAHLKSREEDWLHQIVRVISSLPVSSEVSYELMATLASLDDAAIEWNTHCVEGMVDVLQRTFESDEAADDMLCEALRVVGLLALEEGSNKKIAESNIIRSIFSNAAVIKSNDLEIQLFLLHTFCCLLIHPFGRQQLLQDDKVLTAPLRLLESSNALVKQQSEILVQMISKNHAELKQKILRYKFIRYNEEWYLQLARQHTPGVLHSNSERHIQQAIDTNEQANEQVINL